MFCPAEWVSIKFSTFNQGCATTFMRSPLCTIKMKRRIIFLALSLSLFSCMEKSKEVIFWDWFSSVEEEFHADYIRLKGSPGGKTLGTDHHNRELLTELHKVNPNIYFEITYNKDRSINLTFTAEGMIEVFPAVDSLVKAAPKYERWKIFAFRQRVDGDDFTVEYDQYKISYSDIFFQYSTENDELGIQLNVRNYDETGQMQNAIYLLLDNLIGEEDVVKKIDWIDWVPLKEESKDSLLPLIELRQLVDSMD